MSQAINVLLAELSNRINTYLVENQTGDITATKHKAIEDKWYETLAQLGTEIDNMAITGTTIYFKTRAEILALIVAQGLFPGAYYYITDRKVLLRAASVQTLNPKGFYFDDSKSKGWGFIQLTGSTGDLDQVSCGYHLMDNPVTFNTDIYTTCLDVAGEINNSQYNNIFRAVAFWDFIIIEHIVQGSSLNGTDITISNGGGGDYGIGLSAKFDHGGMSHNYIYETEYHIDITGMVSEAETLMGLSPGDLVGLGDEAFFYLRNLTTGFTWDTPFSDYIYEYLTYGGIPQITQLPLNNPSLKGKSGGLMQNIFLPLSGDIEISGRNGYIRNLIVVSSINRRVLRVFDSMVLETVLLPGGLQIQLCLENQGVIQAVQFRDNIATLNLWVSNLGYLGFMIMESINSSRFILDGGGIQGDGTTYDTAGGWNVYSTTPDIVMTITHQRAIYDIPLLLDSLGAILELAKIPNSMAPSRWRGVGGLITPNDPSDTISIGLGDTDPKEFSNAHLGSFFSETPFGDKPDSYGLTTSQNHPLSLKIAGGFTGFMHVTLELVMIYTS